VSEGRVALLLIAHGSRRPEANADLERVASELGRRGCYSFVQASFLELAEPSIDAGAARCVAAGAVRVVMLPFFLSPGKHVVDDLAAARDALAERYPTVRFVLARPIGAHPLILQVIEEHVMEVESPGEPSPS
jgi:sirohydrochlorin ferrochelatase